MHMKITVAIDSFKGSLSSLEAGCAARDGIMRVYPDAEVFIRPVADGGEGTVDALVRGLNGKKQLVLVSDPLGRKITAEYGIAEKTAIIEMSAAAGITLISDSERNPLNTTTYGVGEIILDAYKKGCRNFIIGIGGSATNDGGIGMLQALGFKMQDKNGNDVAQGAKGLKDLNKITTDNVLMDIGECTFNVACDVTNPLCGDAGCSRIFAPQKGADEEMIELMECWLMEFAKTSKSVYPDADPEAKGAGAAGGLGFALMTFLNAELKGGIDLILKETNIEEYIKKSDIVITGEGRLDGQTVMGKAPVGVAKIAKMHGKTVIAVAGGVTEEAKACNVHGIDAYFPIIRGVTTLEEALCKENAYKNLADSIEQIFRLIKITKD